MNDVVDVEDEDADPVGLALRTEPDPLARFTQAAVDAGLIRPGDSLDDSVVELCLAVVGLAAAVGDRYGIPGMPDESVGDDIRAVLYP